MNANVEQVNNALTNFDTNLRHREEWSSWIDNQSYKYAIINDSKLYPVKQIVSMAARLPKTEFSGGDVSNKLLTGLGFKIISLRIASWTIKSADLASKVLDKSAFTQGTGIPVEVRPFFIKDEIQVGEHRPVELTVNGKIFSAYIAIESSPTKRTRLFWSKNFISEIADGFPIHYQYVQDGKELDELAPAELIFKRVAGFERYSISLAEGKKQGKEWSDDELEETVKAYLWMLEQESSGNPYSKSEVNGNLREGKLNLRTKASIEYRMQNISSVLEDAGMARIKGYLPAQNVGAKTKNKIIQMLQKLGAFVPDDYKPSADQEIFDKRVSLILKKGVKDTPVGQENPLQIITTTTAYVRDPLVKAWVLDNAKGKCEGCGCPAPFLNIEGVPFLEVHHVMPLADGGTDKVENAVALCPNCHRRCHMSNDKVLFSMALYDSVSRLVV